MLVPAFARSLKDGFHHARVAGLMALQGTGGLNACIKHFQGHVLTVHINLATAEFYDALDCSTRIVPCISLVLLDKEK